MAYRVLCTMIHGFPTIQIFSKGEEPKDYEGGRAWFDIVAQAMDLFSANAPPPGVLTIINQDIFKTTCEDHQLCIIAVVPHILDTGASGRNGYLDVLMKMANKYKKSGFVSETVVFPSQQLNWRWAEAGSQAELESSLGIGWFGYPAMAALNVRKMKFSLLKGSFSETGIHEFLRDMSVGRGSTAPVGGGALPKIHPLESWDAKDGQASAFWKTLSQMTIVISKLHIEEDIDVTDVSLDDLEKDEL